MLKRAAPRARRAELCGRTSPRRGSCSVGERFFVPHFTHDGDIGRHAQEAGHQTAKVDLLAVGACRTGLHVGHIWQRHVSFKDFLGHNDAKARVEFGRATRQQRRLARAGSTGEDDRQSSPHARSKEVGHAVVEQLIADAKNSALAHLPSASFAANAAWATCWAIAHNLTRATGALASAPT